MNYLGADSISLSPFLDIAPVKQPLVRHWGLCFFNIYVNNLPLHRKVDHLPRERK